MLVNQVDLSGAIFSCSIWLSVCIQFPNIVGWHNDSEHAYLRLQVGHLQHACHRRTSFYWQMCGNGPNQPIHAMFLATGEAASYPPPEEAQFAQDRFQGLFMYYNRATRPDPQAARTLMGLPPTATRFMAPGGSSLPEAADLRPPGDGRTRPAG